MLYVLQLKEGGFRLETAIDSFQGYTFHFEWEVATQELLLHLVIAIVCIPGFFYCQTSDYYISYGMMIGFFCKEAVNIALL